MSTALVFAVTAHIFWVIGNLLNVKLSRKITPLQTVLWQNIFLVPLLFPFVATRQLNVNVGAIALTMVLSVALYSGSLMFYTAFSKGSAPISGAITATVPAFIALLSIVFLDAKLTSIASLLIGVITVGLLVLSWPQKNSNFDVGVRYAIAAVLPWAIYFTFISKSISELGPYWASYISVIAGFLMLAIYNFIKGNNSTYKLDRKTLLLTATSAVFIGGAPLAYNVAIEQASPAIIAPIAGSYAPLFIIASAIIFKDEVSKRQQIGIVITLISVITFSIVNSR